MHQEESDSCWFPAALQVPWAQESSAGTVVTYKDLKGSRQTVELVLPTLLSWCHVWMCIPVFRTGAGRISHSVDLSWLPFLGLGSACTHQAKPFPSLTSAPSLQFCPGFSSPTPCSSACLLPEPLHPFCFSLLELFSLPGSLVTLACHPPSSLSIRICSAGDQS